MIRYRELEGFPFEGKLHVYGGGGYAAVLGNTARKSRSVISDLKSRDWIDRHTSAVFVEFTVSIRNSIRGMYASMLFRG